MGREVLSQQFTIMPTGRITGGNLRYTMAPDSGTIHFSGEICVRRWFRTRHHRFSGEQRISPVQLRSDHIRVGQSIYLRRIRLRVDHVRDGQAECSVWYDGAYPGMGCAVFDLTGEYLQLKSVVGEGRVRHRSIFGREMVSLAAYEKDEDGHRNN